LDSTTVLYFNLVHNDRNIVHHDIKPENILIDSNNVAKISDFGISNALGLDGTDQIFNHEWGTKLYLPPEAWSSNS
jgi:serine/threonine protein kinase